MCRRRRWPSGGTDGISVEVALLTGQVVTVGGGRTGRQAHHGVSRSYRPEVKLGSPHAVRSGQGRAAAGDPDAEEAPYAEQAAAAFEVSLGEKLRISCCYFYALPNIKACSTCPRFR